MARLLTVTAALVLAGCGTGDAPTQKTREPATSKAPDRVVGPYSLKMTSRCLARKGIRVTRVRRIDARRLAFAQLAQRNSIEARFTTGWVAIAFVRSRLDARGLLEALRLPNDPYRIEAVGSVVLMSPRARARERRIVVGCLR